MTLEDLGNLGEFLGAIGVIVTLAYLALEIRQNTRMMRASIRQARADSALQNQTMTAASNELQEAFLKDEAGEPLDPIEARRLVSYRVGWWRNQETVYLRP